MYWRATILALAIVTLTGCYVSKAPLVLPTTADRPVADGARFNTFAPAGERWLPRPARTVHLAGPYYVYLEEGRPKPSLPFLLKRISPTLYVVQMSDRPHPRPATEYTYQLIEFDGTTAIQHKGICPASPEWVKRRLVDRIEETQTRRCIFSNFQNLATVLREAAKNAAPETKYVLVKGR